MGFVLKSRPKRCACSQSRTAPYSRFAPCTQATSKGFRSRLLEAHVLVGRGEVELGAQPDRRFLHPRTNTMKDGGLKDRAEHDTLVHEALDPMQQRLALLAVALLRLLLEEVIDVGIAPGGVWRAADHEGLDADCRATRRRRGRRDDPAELLRPPRVHERRSLHATYPRANAHCGEVVGHGLPHGRERWHRRQVAGVEATNISGLGKEPLSLFRVVRIRLEAKCGLHVA